MTGSRPDLAYKFLAVGAVGPMSGYAWPRPANGVPGSWVLSGELALCASGAHVCRPRDLAFWIHHELWRVEVAGARLEGLDCLVVERARLLSRVEDWSRGGAEKFVKACAEHIVELARNAETGLHELAQQYAEDALLCATQEYAACGAYSAAIAAATLDPAAPDVAFRREREWQSRWLMAHVVNAANG